MRTKFRRIVLKPAQTNPNIKKPIAMIQRTASIIILLLIVVNAFGQRKEFEQGKKINRVEQEQIRDLQDLLFQNKRSQVCHNRDWDNKQIY